MKRWWVVTAAVSAVLATLTGIVVAYVAWRAREPVPLPSPTVDLTTTYPDPFPELKRWPLENLVPVPTEMVLVPAGEFLFGPNNQKRTLSAFYIDKYELTQWQYAIFLEYIRRTGDHSRCHPDEPPQKDHTPLGWGQPSLTDRKYPVVGLDYWDVYAYASWAGRRLPTEEEWEKAARGTDGRLYPWGNQWDPSRCNWGPRPGLPRTLVPVDSMPEGQSPYGCFHMLGNAAEWTSTVANEEKGTIVGKGYCWMLGHLRPYVATYRMLGSAELRDLGSGLRCALDADREVPAYELGLPPLSESARPAAYSPSAPPPPATQD